MSLAIDIPARLDAIDRRKLRLDRLARIRAELVAHDYGAALLSDPINIRYATDTHTFNVWTLHAPGRYVFVPVDGPVVLFEYGTVHVPADRTSTRSTRCARPCRGSTSWPARARRRRPSCGRATSSI